MLMCPLDSVIAQIADLARPIIEYNKETFQTGHTRNVIDAFMSERKKAESGSPFHGEIGINNLRFLVADQFFGGSDSTTQTLLSALLHMANNPKVQERVFVELSQCSSVSYKNKACTPYTEAVIHEVQRMTDFATTSLSHKARVDIKLGKT